MRQLKITKQVTNRDSDSLEKYLKEIGKVSLINVEKEVELAKRIREGDHNALQELTQANLRFVVSVAKQYQNQGLLLPDLINEGNLGLIKAATKFDESKGFKFISYAVWWIRQSILQALAEQARIVRLPLNKIGSITKLNKAFAKLEQDYERPPTVEELSMALDVSHDDVKMTLKNSGRHLSMDAPMGEDEENGVTLLDLISDTDAESPDKHMMVRSLKEAISRSLDLLKPREAEMLCLYYGIGHTETFTLEEIGVKFGLTRERVRQIKEKGLKKLRSTVSSGELKAFLG